MARPQFMPTPYQRGLVEAYAACGTPEYNIAGIVGIAPKTLRRHFRDQLDLGQIRANFSVAKALFLTATDPKAGMKGVIAAIFWLKVRAGWTEKHTVEHTGRNGGPIRTRQALVVKFVDEPSGTD